MCILKSMRKSETKMTNLFGIYLRMLQYHSHHEVSIGSGTLIFCSMERPLSVRSLGRSSRASNNPATVRTEGGLTPKSRRDLRIRITNQRNKTIYHTTICISTIFYIFSKHIFKNLICAYTSLFFIPEYHLISIECIFNDFLKFKFSN